MPIDPQDEHNTCPSCGHRLPHHREGCMVYGISYDLPCGCTYGQRELEEREREQAMWRDHAARIDHAREARIEAARKAHYEPSHGATKKAVREGESAEAPTDSHLLESMRKAHYAQGSGEDE